MYLSSFRGLLRDLERRLRAVRQEVSFDIVDLRGLDERRDLRRRKMRLLKLLRRGEVRDERAVMASDDDRARTRLFALLDEVALVEAFARVRCLQLLCELVVADAADIHDGVRGKDILDDG